jgi:hypothetical protein
MSIFQPSITSGKKDFMGKQMSYDNQYFYCPRIYAKDGFNVSLQIHNGNYCGTENGYRTLGHTYESVEFGFTSEHEPLMSEYGDNPNDTTGTVGNIPITVLEEVFIKHGGIDWEKTISIEQFNKILRTS